jgi:hypothetical protein
MSEKQECELRDQAQTGADSYSETFAAMKLLGAVTSPIVSSGFRRNSLSCRP